MPYFGVPIRNGISPGLGSVIGFGSRNPIQAVITALFGSGEQGVAVPDLTPNNGFLFQDSAGVTPVTGYEQKVGYILDRSGRGNHIRTTNSTSAPTLSARYNRLTYSEDFSNGAWVKLNASATAGQLTDNSTNGQHYVTQTIASVSGTAYFCTVELKAGTASWAALSVDNLANGFVWFDLSNGVKGTQQSAVTGTISAVGDGWYRCTLAFTANGTANYFKIGVANADNSFSYAGTGSTVSVRKADLRLTIDTIAQPAYQRVGAATDYDTAGFYPYLNFAGTQAMYTAASVDFSATAQMTVFSGITRLSDAAAGLLIELTTNLNNNAGAFNLATPDGANTVIGAAVSQGNNINYNTGSYTDSAAPLTEVLSAGYDKSLSSNEIVFINKNGSSQSLTRALNDNTTGNFANKVLYFASRAGSSVFYTGRLYPFFVCGASKSAGVISQVENFIKARMPISY